MRDKRSTRRHGSDRDPAAPDGERLPAEVRAAIEAIKSRERVLLRALEDDETTAQFLEAPHAVLRKLKLPVSAALEHFLRRGEANRREDFQGHPVMLPNGQVLRPRVRVRIGGAPTEG